MKIDIEDFINYEMEEELLNLEKCVPELSLPNKLNYKFLAHVDEKINLKRTISKKLSLIDNVNLLKKVTNFSDDELFESYIFVLREKEGKTKLKKYWAVLINKDIFLFTDLSKDRLKHIIHLSTRFLNYERSKISIKDTVYNSFSIHSMKERTYYTSDISIADTWVRKIKEQIGYRSYYENYTNVGILGEGAYETVYKAEHIKSRKLFAVKKFNKLEQNENELKHIKREIEILQYCNHPNIIKCFEYYEDYDRIYVVTEYMPDGDLSGFNARRR